MVFSGPIPPAEQPESEKEKWTFKRVLRLILLSPFKLVRFLVLLPFRTVIFLVKLPKRIWRAWSWAALMLYKARMQAMRLKVVYYEGKAAARWVRIHAPRHHLKRTLYHRFHPVKLKYYLCCRRTALRGRKVWSSSPELEAVHKAIIWARNYRRHESRFRDIEALRSILYADTTPMTDLRHEPPIGLVASQESTKPRWGALLHGLIQYTQTQRALELGTTFGISSLYIARGLLDVYPVRTCSLISLESDYELARIAERQLNRLGYSDFAQVMDGERSYSLDRALEQVAPLQFVHMSAVAEGAMLPDQIALVMPHAVNGTVIAVEGIHASSGHTRAWQTIKELPRVAAAVDLWKWGILIIGETKRVDLCARI